MRSDFRYRPGVWPASRGARSCARPGFPAPSWRALLIILIGLIVAGGAKADPSPVLAQSAAHKLKVLADGAKWCGPHLALRMLVDADSPDAGRTAGLVDLMNRLKGPIETDCAGAVDASLTLSVQDKIQGTYKASKSGGWQFAAASGPGAAAAHEPASLDTPEEQRNAAPAPSIAGTQPGDVPGSHDPAFLKRYAGSKIIAYATRPYDQLLVFVDDDLKPKTVEGAMTRILYHVPEGHTCLEILRNYEETVKELGFKLTGEILPCNADYGRLGYETRVWQQTPMQLSTDGGNPYSFGCPTDCGPDGPMAYFSASGTKDGKDITIGVMVVEKHHNLTYTSAGATPAKFADGDIAVGVDLVAAKSVDINMVQVKAADIADALASKGSFALYGILFDTDKADIKPESTKTLDEVASLLKIDRALSLEISGHTDNTGPADHNLKLSQDRAQAVVDTLVKQYGIDAARLQAKGYGDTMPVADNATDDGKAKNRRVELRKI